MQLLNPNAHQIFKDATVFLSSDESTIANVIPTMDLIEERLSTRSSRPLHALVKAAMRLARSTMDHYYSETDLSNVYRIAMSM